jgi:tetratricopeptide (TPR) repeat protein
LQLDLEPILEQVQVGDPVGAAYRLSQSMGTGAEGRAFYEAGSLALARRDELGEDALRFARIVFAEAVERDPQLGEAHHDLATTMRELGMAQDAIPHYRRALDLMPGDVDALIGLGAAQCDSGLIDDGVATLRRATEEHPDSGQAFANLGVALEACGRDIEAAAAYASAVARFDGAVNEASDDDVAAEMAARRRWGRVQHALLLERLERWPQAVVEYRRLYEEEEAIAEAAEAEDADEAEQADGAETGEPAEGEAEDREGDPRVLDSDIGDALTAAALAEAQDEQHGHAAGEDEDEEPTHGDPDPEAAAAEPDENDLANDQDMTAGRLGLERLFTRFVQLGKLDLAYLVLDDLGGELSDQRTRATYAIYDAGDGLPQIMVERWDGGKREKLDPTKTR